MTSEFEAGEGSRKPRWRAGNTLPALSAVALLAACGGGPSVERSRAALLNSINPKKELSVIDVSVVGDATRSLDPCDVGQEPLPPWSFGKIMQILADQAGAPDASAFVKDWLDTWTTEQVVNGHVLTPVPIDQFVTIPWLAASGGDRLDLGRAYFRLLSIVNRIDLSQQDGKGEFRMEYVATNVFCQPIHFWMIFEFELPVESLDDLRALAQRWHALSELPFGEDYNAALQAITDDLTSARLKHVNTVEEEASVLEWNFRSFAIAGQSLVNVPMFQSPDVLDDGSPPLVHWVNANQKSILADDYVVPDELLGGDTRNIDWLRIGFEDPDEVGHHFALGTCNGCHGGETGILSEVTQLRWRHQGEQTVLSPYLTGETILDPRGHPRTFNELGRRAGVLQLLLLP
jgi:hypothetical protein